MSTMRELDEQLMKSLRGGGVIIDYLNPQPEPPGATAGESLNPQPEPPGMRKAGGDPK